MAADKCERFPMPILDSVELCHCHGDLRTKLMLLVTCVVAGPLCPSSIPGCCGLKILIAALGT